MTLTDFLLARIAEDESVANGALVDVVPDIDGKRRDWRAIYIDYEGISLWASSAAVTSDKDLPSTRHIGRWNTTRVLAECSAKRQIVELHGPRRIRSTAGLGQDRHGSPLYIEDCRICNHFPGRYPCLTLRLLALPYADHPDYDEAWRP